MRPVPARVCSQSARTAAKLHVLGVDPERIYTRFYEARGLLPAAARTLGGYRDFGPGTTARVEFIRRGRSAGLTLAQIGEILDVSDAGSPRPATGSTCC